MEYPKTEDVAIDSLKGSWKIEGSNVTFAIEEKRMFDITNYKDSMGLDLTHFDFSIEFDINHWFLTNRIFGSKAEIVKWEDDSFTTTHFPVVTKPADASKITMKFVRVS